MNVVELLADLESRNVLLTVVGGDLHYDAPSGVLSDADIDALKIAKPALLGLHLICEGDPEGMSADDLLGYVIANPSDIPLCDRCGRFCDVQTLAESWHCSNCDPLADARKQRTMHLLESVQRLARKQVNNNDNLTT